MREVEKERVKVIECKRDRERTRENQKERESER